MPKFIVRPDGAKSYTIKYQSGGYEIIHGRSPYPNEETRTWFFFDDTEGKFIDSGIPYAKDCLEKSDIATIEALKEYLGISK